MPCYSDIDHPDHPDNPAQIVKRLNREIAILTPLACTMLRILELSGQPIPVNAKQWWLEHKKSDARKELA